MTIKPYISLIETFLKKALIISPCQTQNYTFRLWTQVQHLAIVEKSLTVKWIMFHDHAHFFSLISNLHSYI